MEKKYQGVIVPAITPLTANHQLDSEAVEKIFTGFRKHKIIPFILGTTGEAASLSHRIKTEYVKAACSLKQHNEILFAGISSNCLEESVSFANEYFQEGVDVVVATLPSYYQLSERQMQLYFEQMAEAISGPLIIYNIPATTHTSIPLSVIDELSYHEKIVGVKDSERDLERLRKSLELWSNRKDFSHFIGWAAQSAEALLNGSDGIIPSTGNFHPALYHTLYEAAQKQDRTKALHLQKHSDLLGNLYQSGRSLGDSLAALKFLMHEIGLCQPYVMPPLQILSEEDRTTLRKNFHDLKNDEQLTVTI